MKIIHYLKENLISELERKLEDISNGIDVNVTKHFLDRIYDRSINLNDVINTFEKFVNKYGNTLASDKQKRISDVLKDLATALNIPLYYDNKGTATPKDDIISLITVMKKKDFVPNNKNDKIFKV
jgi:hypothetical protein